MMPLIVIAGPTASGKSALGMALAQHLNGEIVSADSMQIYQGMDIGTAKEINPPIAHHLINVVKPDTPFSVATYQKLARTAVAEILAKGKQPIVVGGTGFYLNALLYDVSFEVPPNLAYRETLANLAKTQGVQVVYERLMAVDPVYASTIHPNNVAKITRAIEYHHTTGQRLSDQNQADAQAKPMYDTKTFILDLPREGLYQRINERVEAMVQQGLVAEVAGLLAQGYGADLPAMGSIGYKETVNHLKGVISLEEMVAQIQQNTRNYAKRQVTWLRNKTKGQWIDAQNTPLEEILKGL